MNASGVNTTALVPSATDLEEMYRLGLLSREVNEHPRTQLQRKLGTQELATLLGVTAETVRRQIKAGQFLPDTVTPGGHARFTRLTALRLYRSASPSSAEQAALPPSSPPHPQDLP